MNYQKDSVKKWQDGRCPLCDFTADFFCIESHTDSGTTYDLYGCKKCFAQFWIPLKNPGAEWYEKDKRYAGANEDPTLEPNWNHRKTISFLAPFAGDVLDVGCGTGNFLGWAKNNGWKVWGIDFDRNAVAAARAVFGIENAEVSDLFGVPEAFYAKFDLVSFFDVFEHIDNHNQFLEKIHTLLKPNGYIAMSMPYRYGARWLQPNDLPPRHLTRWDRRSLQTILKRHNFAVRYIKRVPVSFFDIVMKLRFKYGRYTSFNVVNRMREPNNSIGKIPSTKNLKSKKDFSVRVLHFLAKIKDVVIFVLPSFLLWFILLFTKKRYTGLYPIAQTPSPHCGSCNDGRY